MKLKFVCLVVFSFIIGCDEPSQTNSMLDSSIASDTANVPTSVFLKKDTLNSKEEIELKKKFTIKKDDFKQTTFYLHKHWGFNYPTRTTISCYFNDYGTLFLKSNFHSSDWIFHTKVSVIIGDEILESSEVPSYNENNIHENSGGEVWEQVTYDSDDDKKIIEEIADNTEKKVRVRFEGTQHYHDIVLSQSDKNAFRDVLKLYNSMFKQ